MEHSSRGALLRTAYRWESGDRAACSGVSPAVSGQDRASIRHGNFQQTRRPHLSARLKPCFTQKCLRPACCSVQSKEHLCSSLFCTTPHLQLPGIIQAIRPITALTDACQPFLPLCRLCVTEKLCQRRATYSCLISPSVRLYLFTVVGCLDELELPNNPIGR
ncbi:uncharacterized protein BDZ83DRAFT_106761 [Colletotrichum acutatum]|uniref:Uncharacterized protein n=1 Tax=Glomerella acutata TaxID=27357 RepID=A0AAD8XAM3_GLOAC|nr:uncharacterized protein BDZ83DRAFT_106761 [Colletotrichum acutatum]KAK1711967.1 hypothetical protein BDZ83DRAFT_106761 [Colletotrichum acutatum]